jgi:hypothetical protein
MSYNMNIIKYFGWVLGVEFGELIADYVKDEAGTWWLVNVKAFRITKEVAKKIRVNPKLAIEEP